MGILSALQYGVIGLSGIMLILSWRILAAEQRRSGTPRAGLLRHLRLFMIFCGALALTNGILQSVEHRQTMADAAARECKNQLANNAADLTALRSEIQARDRTSRDLRGLLHSMDQLLKQKLKVEVARPVDAGSAERLKTSIGYIQEDLSNALKLTEKGGIR